MFSVSYRYLPFHLVELSLAMCNMTTQVNCFDLKILIAVTMLECFGC